MQQSPIASRISAFLLLTVLVAVLFAAPVKLAAQATSATNTAAPAAVSQPNDTAKPEAAKSQEEQNEAFLLEGWMVKWTVKTFHIDAKTASNIYLFINFGIIVLLLGVPLMKVGPKLLHARGDSVKSGFDAARKATAQANARLNAIESKLGSLDEEIAQIKAQVEEESKLDEARIKASLVEETARIVAAAEQEISVAAAQARRGLRSFAAEQAIDQAASKLIFTPETDRALIAEFLSEANNHATQKGVQS